MSDVYQRGLFPMPYYLSKKTKKPFHTIAERYSHCRLDSIGFHNYVQIWFFPDIVGVAHEFVGDKAYELERGSLVIIPSYVTHCIDSSRSEATLGYCLNLSSAFFDNNGVLSDCLFIPSCNIFGDFELPRYVRVSDDMFDQTDALFRKMYEISIGSADSLPIDSELRRLFDTVLSKFATPRQKRDVSGLRETKQAIDKVELYMIENLNSKITADELAKIAAMSRSSFFSSFKTITGTTYSTHLLLMRLARTFDALCGPNEGSDPLPLEYISSVCGFSSKSHLIKTLKQYTNLTPKQLKERDSMWLTEFSHLFP